MHACRAKFFFMPNDTDSSESSVEAVIVVGAGLAGLSAAHMILECGGRVVLVERSNVVEPPRGNSARTCTGISGCCSRVQIEEGYSDSPAIFMDDILKNQAKKSDLIEVLCEKSGEAVDWLGSKFDLAFVVSRSGAHSVERTHKCNSRSTGLSITSALAKSALEVARDSPDKLQIITGARVQSLEKNPKTGQVCGVIYESEGKNETLHGPVVLATGGFGADLASEASLVKTYRPDLGELSTACNLDTTSGDGIRMGEAVGAKTVDMMYIQLHPCGLVDPANPESREKLIASESLRGDGGIILNREGIRFVNELSKRDELSNELRKHKGMGPFRLVLNSRISKHVKKYLDEYKEQGLVVSFESGNELAESMGVDPNVLESSFAEYNRNSEISKADANSQLPFTDKFGKSAFRNCPFQMSDSFHVALIEPVIHHCIGGLAITPQAHVVKTGTTLVPIPGLYAAGEVAEGVHACANPLAGNDLLDCVVFGRMAGLTASRDLYGADYVEAHTNPERIREIWEAKIHRQEEIRAARMTQVGELKHQIEGLSVRIREEGREMEIACKKAASDFVSIDPRLSALRFNASGKSISELLSVADAKGLATEIRLKRKQGEDDVQHAKHTEEELAKRRTQILDECEKLKKQKKKLISDNEKLTVKIEALRNSSSVIREIHQAEEEVKNFETRQQQAEAEKSALEAQLAASLANGQKEVADLVEKTKEVGIMMGIEKVEQKRQLSELGEVIAALKPKLSFEKHFAVVSAELASNAECPVFQQPLRIPPMLGG